MPKQDPQDARWYYIPLVQFGRSSVFKVLLHETEKQYKVMECVAVYGTAFTWYKGKTLKKLRWEKDLFVWFKDALQALLLRTGGIEQRAATTLRIIQEDREAIRTLLAQMKAEEAEMQSEAVAAGQAND